MFTAGLFVRTRTEDLGYTFKETSYMDFDLIDLVFIYIKVSNSLMRLFTNIIMVKQ